MNSSALERLRDIHELDTVSWWPPAIGWWLLAGAIISILWLSIWLLKNLRAYPPGTWHRDARNQLLALKKLSRSMSAEHSLRELSELLRRIAVTRLGREVAAGLSGEQWLIWLEQHDPQHFPWSKKGQALTTVPYSPPGHCQVDTEQVRQLIQAALIWARRERRLEP